MQIVIYWFSYISLFLTLSPCPCMSWLLVNSLAHNRMLLNPKHMNENETSKRTKQKYVYQTELKSTKNTSQTRDKTTNELYWPIIDKHCAFPKKRICRSYTYADTRIIYIRIPRPTHRIITFNKKKIPKQSIKTGNSNTKREENVEKKSPIQANHNTNTHTCCTYGTAPNQELNVNLYETCV